MIENAVSTKRSDLAGLWAERIRQQKRSGLTISQFCQDRGFSDHSFYAWRKRLLNTSPVRFALVEPATAQSPASTQPSLELLLPRGERLRIYPGVDEATLRTTLEALRA